MDATGHEPGKSRAPGLGGCAAVLGVAMFLVVVLTLHVVQTHYDPVNQLMSELALGSQGWAMFFAFAGIALALTGIQFSIGPLGDKIDLLVVGCRRSPQRCSRPFGGPDRYWPTIGGDVPHPLDTRVGIEAVAP